MSAFNIKDIIVRVGVVISPGDDRYDLHEDFKEFPITDKKILVTENPQDVPGYFILGLDPEGIRDEPTLWRIKNYVKFLFDKQDAQGTFEEGALKIIITYEDRETVDITYYPFEFQEAVPQMPQNTWHWILKRKDTGGDPEYYLIFAKPGGGGVVNICADCHNNWANLSGDDRRWCVLNCS